MTMQNHQNGNPTFPAELTAEMLADFRATPRGCTHPRVGRSAGIASLRNAAAGRYIQAMNTSTTSLSPTTCCGRLVSTFHSLASIVLILRTDAGVKRSALQSMTMR